VLTGGDLLANGLWVLVLGALAIAARGGWRSVAAAAAFGVGLSSRLHFALLLPMAFVAIGKRWGWGSAAARCGIALGVAAVVTLPFYLWDPAGFSPLHVRGKLDALGTGVRATVVGASGIVSCLASGWLAGGGRARDSGAILALGAVVLAVPVLLAAGIAAVEGGMAEWAEYGWYAVGGMGMGVLGASEVFRSRAPARAPSS
jgi:hypothetical protein